MEDIKEQVTDLGSLDSVAACNKGFDLEIEHPITKVGTGVFIQLVGKDSDTFQQHVRATSNDRLRRNFQRQRKGKDADAPTVEEIEREAIDLLVTCTRGWKSRIPGEKDKFEPTVTLNGEKLPFSEANARRLYQSLPVVRAQVDEAIGDLENFMPGSSRSS